MLIIITAYISLSLCQRRVYPGQIATSNNHSHSQILTKGQLKGWNSPIPPKTCVFYCGGNLDNLVRHSTCREYTEKSLASGRFKPGTLLLYVNSANPCNTISSWESIHLQPPADIWGLPVKVIIPTDTKNMVGGVVPQLPPHWACDSPWLTVYWPQPSELLLVCCHLHWEKGKDFRRHYHSGRNLVNNSTWLSFGRTITLCINSLP